jgi:uncharacterized protein (UPF0332 family)
MTEESIQFLKKADHALEVAEALISDGYPSDAASKIYYAMFYAAQALLKSEGINVVKHSAVESAFEKGKGHIFICHIKGKLEKLFFALFYQCPNGFRQLRQQVRVHLH